MLFLPRLKVSKKSESSPSWNGGTYRPTSPAEPRVLDLQDFGAEVGQLQRAHGPGAVLLDGDDPDVGERECHAAASRRGPPGRSRSRPGPASRGRRRVEGYGARRPPRRREPAPSTPPACRPGRSCSTWCPPTPSDSAGDARRPAPVRLRRRPRPGRRTTAGTRECSGSRAASPAILRTSAQPAAKRSWRDPDPASNRRQGARHGRARPPNGLRPRAAAHPAQGERGSIVIPSKRKKRPPREARLTAREELAQGEHGLVRTRPALGGGLRPMASKSLAALAADADPEHDPPASRGSRATRAPSRRGSGRRSGQQDDSGADAAMRSVTAAKVDRATTTSRIGLLNEMWSPAQTES